MEKKAKLIYNPHAGKKRRLIQNPVPTLEEIKSLLEQYQILVDYQPTQRAGHGTILARKAVDEGYDLIIAAGGDGTIGEVAQGLVKTKATLGIIPLGSFMNIARMLSIPQEAEKAVMLLRIGRSRKIDVGSLTHLGGEKLPEKYFFLESVGMGLEAQLQEHILELEKGHLSSLLKIFSTLFDFYGHRAFITLDNEKTTSRATLITVSNGPYSGAALQFAPKAKLNDHKLTLTEFKMSKLELFEYFFGALRYSNSWWAKKLQLKRRLSPKITTHQADKIKIETRFPRLVHADARLYGQTPITMEIVPNALRVITGFPAPSETPGLIRRTELDP